ncbi:MAG: hypothetical protein ISS26_02645 [Candidatus Omnitrophica bacterium]|nr:hypothetical protein [Candidatus Omnitrophota bacterium]
MNKNVKINPILIVLFIFIVLLAMPYSLQALMPIERGEGIEFREASDDAQAPEEELERGERAGTVDYEQVAPTRKYVPSESGLGTEGGGIKEIKKEKQRILRKARWERPQVRKRPFETDQTMKKGPILLRPEVEKEGYIEFMNQRSTKEMIVGFIVLVGLYFLYKRFLQRLKNYPE